MWHMQGSRNGLCDLRFSYVFIDIFPPGRGFSFGNIEFSFLVFPESDCEGFLFSRSSAGPKMSFPRAAAV